MMPVTVFANNLTISHKGSLGFEFCTIPDVCLTPAPPAPPVPIPYPIISFSKDIVRGTTTVKADRGNSIDHRSSAHRMCIGDQPGTIGGVVSGVMGKESHWITCSPNVFVQRKNVARLTDMMFMNNKNTFSMAHLELFFLLMLLLGNPVVNALCKIFCEVLEEWTRLKAKGKAKEKPSRMAEKRVKAELKNPKSDLSQAINQKYGKEAKGRAERTYYTGVDDNKMVFDGARMVYETQKQIKAAITRGIAKAAKKRKRPDMAKEGATFAKETGKKMAGAAETFGKGMAGKAKGTDSVDSAAEFAKGTGKQLKGALDRQVNALQKKKIIGKNTELSGKEWMRMVPGLHMVPEIADNPDQKKKIADVRKSVRETKGLPKKVIKVKPDFSVQGGDGKVADIFDFKFPGDNWQKKQKQKEAYKAALGGKKKPKKIDAKICNCGPTERPKKPVM